MTMWKVPPKHSKLYLATIGTIYCLLVVAIIILAAYTNNWIFWIISTLIEIIIIYVGITNFIKLM